jgi:hypothetical protein
MAHGFGDLTVHEVTMEKAKALKHVAYFSWYSGGFRVAVFDSDTIRQRASSSTRRAATSGAWSSAGSTAEDGA